MWLLRLLLQRVSTSYELEESNQGVLQVRLQYHGRVPLRHNPQTIGRAIDMICTKGTTTIARIRQRTSRRPLPHLHVVRKGAEGGQEGGNAATLKPFRLATSDIS
jgi:hypothetical protein